MAIWSVADQSGASPIIYRKRWNQTQRKIPTLRLISQMDQIKRADTPNNITWGATFDGQNAAAVNLDGGAFLAPTSDQAVPTTLVYGSYSAPVRFTDDIVWKLSQNSGADVSINAMLAEPIQENVMNAGAKALKVFNQHIFIGSGSSNQMVGAATALAASGTYAGIAASSQSQWASTVTANGGVLQSLTLGRVKTLLETVSNGSSEGRPDFAVCRGPVFSAWGNLFEQFTQVPVVLGVGPATPRQRVDMTPQAITLTGSVVKSDGFRVMYWANENLYILEDNDAVDQGATNANNSIFFFNSMNMEFLYLPPPSMGPRATEHRPMTAAEQDMGELANIPFDFVARGRTDYSDTFDMMAKCSIVFRSRNAHAKLQDQQ